MKNRPILASVLMFGFACGCDSEQSEVKNSRTSTEALFAEEDNSYAIGPIGPVLIAAGEAGISYGGVEGAITIGGDAIDTVRTGENHFQAPHVYRDQVAESTVEFFKDIFFDNFANATVLTVGMIQEAGERHDSAYKADQMAEEFAARNNQHQMPPAGKYMLNLRKCMDQVGFVMRYIGSPHGQNTAKTDPTTFAQQINVWLSRVAKDNGCHPADLKLLFEQASFPEVALYIQYLFDEYEVNVFGKNGSEDMTDEEKKLAIGYMAGILKDELEQQQSGSQ